MKKIFFCSLLAVSLNSIAQTADYSCDIRQYRLEVNLTNSLSTSMWLTDTFNYYTVAQGYAGFMAREGDKTVFSFYPGQASPMKLTFKTQDIIDFPEIIKGRIDTMAGGFMLKENMDCSRR